MPSDKKIVSKTPVSGTSAVSVSSKSAAAAKAQPIPTHKLDDQSDLSKFGDLIKPVPPTKNNVGEFSQTGPVWWLGLDNNQTHALSTVLATASGLSAPFVPVIAAALAASIGYIELVNTVGGSNGVDINGVIGVEGLIVTPRVGGFYGDLIQAARLVVSGRTILDFLIIASHEVPALASALNLGVVATVLNAVESGTPIGWALAGALGLAVDLLGSEPDPNQHGHIWANRDAAGEWESFVLAKTGDGDKVSLLSWQGLFSAQMGGGGDVYANRPQVGDWETWTLIDNNDGTVSFKSFNGNYLSAEQGGGAALYANRTIIGTWEKFYLVTLSGGKIALKSHDKGKFVSVQQ
ncbi:MAG TPA: hypothetical protein VH088_17340 [Terriglobales bacterium]|nr:hypothetical protein [Terriglobales bacterium]